MIVHLLKLRRLFPQTPANDVRTLLIRETQILFEKVDHKINAKLLFVFKH